jgi:murein DD-endopeptidase MepM/ murein hydrolase activator NlpD
VSLLNVGLAGDRPPLLEPLGREGRATSLDSAWLGIRLSVQGRIQRLAPRFPKPRRAVVQEQARLSLHADMRFPCSSDANASNVQRLPGRKGAGKGLRVVSETTPRFAGRVVDPSVADEDDEVPVEQLSEEPPVASLGPDLGLNSDPLAPASGQTQGSTPETSRSGRRVNISDEPGLRPQAFPPLPPSEVLLDPSSVPPPIPQHRPKRATPTLVSPTMTAVFGALFGLAGVFALFALLQRVSPHPTPGSASASMPASNAGAVGSADAAIAEPLPTLDDEPGTPGPWRVSALRDDDAFRVVEGTVGLDPLVDTLESKHISRKEIYRILSALKSFKGVVDKPGKSAKYIAAVDRAAGRVRAFELELSPIDIYQAKENDEQRLVGDKLDMKLGSRRALAGVRMVDDLTIDLRRARLRESVADVVDRAFDGRAHLAGMPRGSSLRVIVVEQTSLDRFASYDHIEAMEYVSSKEGAEPLRIYRVKDGSHWGYFDQRGREPFRGGWRRPCPGSPITSGFNPRRLHPILHVIKPHLGTDFGAPAGTPIHASFYGSISWLGPSGPAGNLVTLKHPGAIETYYMHMSRFAPGLKVGDKVETFQIIGYVGSTGRSTGPHLHFGVKRKGDWIDPVSLKLDGERVISRDAREEFDKLRAELDPLLDSIALPPAPPSVAPEPPSAASASASTSASAEPAGSSEPAQGIDETEGLDELEPEGTVDPNDKPDKPKK